MNNSLICVDASIVVGRIMGLDDLSLQEQWRARVDEGKRLIAPQLLYYEVTNVIYQIGKGNRLSDKAMIDAVQLLIELPIDAFSDVVLHSRAMQLARELSLGATYDAHYLALAQHLECEFWTRDAKLVRASEKKYDWVRLLN